MLKGLPQNNIYFSAWSFDRWLRCPLVADHCGYAPRSRLASGHNPDQLKATDQARAALDKGREILRTRAPDLRGKDLGSAWWDVLMDYILMSEAEKTVGAAMPGHP